MLCGWRYSLSSFSFFYLELKTGLKTSKPILPPPLDPLVRRNSFRIKLFYQVKIVTAFLMLEYHLSNLTVFVNFLKKMNLDLIKEVSIYGKYTIYFPARKNEHKK